MKRKMFVLLAILTMVLMVAPAMATTQTFSVTGTDTAGDPISAMATFTTGAGTITVDVWNTHANPIDIGQDISDLGFVLSTGQTTGSINSFSATARTLGAGGTFSDVAAATSHWVLDTAFSFGAHGTGLKLDDLAGGGGPGNTIIGPPGAGNLYSAANASFNAGPHPPEWFGTAATPVEFHLNVAGVTAGSTVTFVDFSFGTTAGDDHPGTQVPIPPSALLLGSGLLGLVGIGWRRKKIQ
jgi:hypothetical protein